MENHKYQLSKDFRVTWWESISILFSVNENLMTNYSCQNNSKQGDRKYKPIVFVPMQGSLNF